MVHWCQNEQRHFQWSRRFIVNMYHHGTIVLSHLIILMLVVLSSESRVLRHLTAGIVRGQFPSLIHWGRVTHICVSKLTTIGSGNAWSPGRRQAISANAEISLIRTLYEQTSVKHWVQFIHFDPWKRLYKCRLRDGAILFRPQCDFKGITRHKTNSGTGATVW